MRLAPPTPTGKITKPGVYEIPISEYHGQPCDALSLSAGGAQTLSEKTPAHLIAEWSAPPKRERKLAFGQCVHTLILEPHRREKQVVIIDDGEFRKQATKDAADAALAAGMTPMLAPDYERAVSAARAVLADDDAGPYFAEGIPESSYFAKDEKTGVWVKARPDWMTPSWVAIDVKTVGSASDEFLQRRIRDGGWFQSAPWQAHVIERVTRRPLSDFLWCCVEQDAPFAIRMIRPTEPSLIHGARLNQKAIDIFARCVRTNDWPAYEHGVTDLGLTDGAMFGLEAAAMREEEVAATRAARLGRKTGAHVFS